MPPDHSIDRFHPHHRVKDGGGGQPQLRPGGGGGEFVCFDWFNLCLPTQSASPSPSSFMEQKPSGRSVGRSVDQPTIHLKKPTRADELTTPQHTNRFSSCGRSWAPSSGPSNSRRAARSSPSTTARPSPRGCPTTVSAWDSSLFVWGGGDDESVDRDRICDTPIDLGRSMLEAPSTPSVLPFSQSTFHPTPPHL